MSFKDGIKGASFLARNCNSMNNREDVVKQLINSNFRVDSLSSCLNNVENTEFDLGNKRGVMRKYLFVSKKNLACTHVILQISHSRKLSI